MNFSEDAEKRFRLVRLIALVMLVLFPVIYLVAVFVIAPYIADLRAGTEMMFYILIVVAILQPLVYPLIQRIQVSEFKSRQGSPMTIDQLYLSVNVVKIALVGMIYIYGAVVALTTGGTRQTLWFYAVGILWSVVYWPRRESFEQFIKGGTA